MTSAAHPIDSAQAPTEGDPDRPERVARLVEQLRLVDAQLVRQRSSPSGFSDADRAVIRLILEETARGSEITPSFIAARLHLTPPAVTAIVDRLSRAGIATVSPHPTDRRKKLVTPMDDSIHADHVDPLTSRLRALAARLSPEDSAVIADFLQDVLTAISAR
ncbi:MarR family transcriptional regulator [Microbacterium caowuchunii]|uniref:MarR family winged helix-turn-helix transcriptional regulator n=1 Tax=Microbacterium caowuchunii TaxID=2614638 RepID=UPI00124464E0|nr:MarR family transcriptional regulator [Microbacterium caowuchunii]QEW00833.1 MarR family transcriptional regulator [Microbacterium caowuchunii]